MSNINKMNKKKIIIAVLVVFIALVAVITLVLKARVKSGATVPSFVKTSFFDQTKTDASTTDASNSESSISVPPVVEPIEVTDPSLNMMPGSPEAPKQEVVAADKVPAKAIKIDMTADGFSPKEFRIKAGAEVTLALSSSDGNTHVFIFPNDSLIGLMTMVQSGETKTVTFNAPPVGSYLFRDDIPAFRANTGTMIVE